MLRHRVAILVGLLLAGTSRAQGPGADMKLPNPTPLVTSSNPATATLPALSMSPNPDNVISFAPAPENSLRFWVNADYGWAWLKQRDLPPLVTTAAPGTAQAAAGVLGLETTSIAIGGQPINDERARSVGRMEAGCWFDRERTFGATAGFFFAESKESVFSVASDGTTILARPFIDINANANSSVLVAFPGISSGSVNVTASMGSFWGANVDLQENIATTSWLRVDSLIGYRFLQYAESLTIQQNLLATGGAFVAGTQIVSNDSFATRNNFHGCEFGFRTEVSYQRWSLDFLAKLAAGSIHREFTIDGSSQTTVPGNGTVTSVGGVYALSSNIASYSNYSWVVAPEAAFTVGYQVTSRFRFRFGYSFLFLQDIARPADQLDFRLNPNLFPPPVASPGVLLPTFNFLKSQMWIQSINAGVEFRY